MEGYITTTEAAKRLGVSSARVRQLVSSGVLPVTRFGPVNMVKESDLDLARNRPGVGRPPKQTTAPENRATGQKRASDGASTGGKKGRKR